MNNTKQLRVGDQPTQAVYGFLRAIRPLIMTYSMLTPVVLWDGMSWRKKIFPDYKASREKPPETQHERDVAEVRAQFKSQKRLICRGLGLLGIRQVLAMNYEADDLAGMMVEKFCPGKTIMMISGDKDWIQLVRPGAAWRDLVRDMLITHKSLEAKLGYKKGEEHIGVPSPRAWLEIKALMGDSSDEIPGVGGIGEKGAIDLLRTYGSVSAFHNQCVDGTIKLSDLSAKFRALAEDEKKMEIWRRNMRLMDLSAPDRPKMQGFTINRGAFDRSKFAEFCREFQFNSILTSFKQWCEPFEGVTA